MLAGLLCSSVSACARYARASKLVVCLDTALGNIAVELDVQRAPITAGHFAELVRRGTYSAGAGFYRSVAPDRDINPVAIDVIQGRLAARAAEVPTISHENTATTGLRHIDGTISMARGVVGTASSEFFICIGENPELDYGGRRAADGEGFAAFGQVVDGMDVVRRIHALPASLAGAGSAFAGQMLADAVVIKSMKLL
jgi:peptidyl-prolyl cis-trans isomerase A (cyclophilin A)